MTESQAYTEDAVLAGVMADNSAFHDVAALLSAEHFTSPLRQRIWRAIRNAVVAGEPADAVTIGDALPDDFADVVQLANNAVTGRTVRVYADLVREHWRKREASGIAQRLLANVREAESGAVDEAIAALMALNADVSEHEFTGLQAMQMAFEQAHRAWESGGVLPGIPTGLSDLDAVLGGWHDSDLVVIGGRPAMGKTAFLLGCVEAAARSGAPVGLVSAEQPAMQIGLRRVSLASGVGAANIRSGRMADADWSRLGEGMRRAKDARIWIYDRSAVSLDELIGVARKWKHAHGIKALFVDYAQRITVRGADRITEVAQVARGLKNLARDLQIPVIALAQVVKGVDSRQGDKRPKAGDLANSDELTREADQILMLYRDAVYQHERPDDGIAEVLIEKNRHGPTGFKRVRFDAETMAFRDLDPQRGLAA